MAKSTKATAAASAAVVKAGKQQPGAEPTVKTEDAAKTSVSQVEGSTKPEQTAADLAVVVAGQSQSEGEANPLGATVSEAAAAAPGADAAAGDASAADVPEVQAAKTDAPVDEAAKVDAAANAGGSDRDNVTDVEFVEVPSPVYPKAVRFFNNSNTVISDTKTGVFLGPAGTHDMTFGDAEHEESILASLEVVVAEAYVSRELVTVETLHKNNEV